MAPSPITRWGQTPLLLTDADGIEYTPDGVEELEDGTTLLWMRVQANPDPSSGTIPQRFANLMFWAAPNDEGRPAARVAWRFPAHIPDRKAAQVAFWAHWTNIQVV